MTLLTTNCSNANEVMTEENNINNRAEIPNSATSQGNTTTGITQVIHEQLHVDKQTIETGRVHVSKKIFQEDYNAEVPLSKEEITIEKVPVNKYVEDAPPSIRLDGDTTIIPVLREVIVKRLLLVEEIHITKRKSERSATIHEVLRKEEVVINRTDSPLNHETNI